MQLSQVLSQINQVERSKFVNCLDKIRSSTIKSGTLLADPISNIDSQLKSAPSGEVTKLFNSIRTQFSEHLTEQLSLAGPQVSLLVNILSRDGNGIARLSWIERLYEVECLRLTELSDELEMEMSQSAEDDDYGRGSRLSIYSACFETAYKNDERLNRENRVTDDERTILITLAEKLGMSSDEATALENLLVPIPKTSISDALTSLREIGVIFITKRNSEVVIADEVASILHDITNKELPDKYTLRILRSLSDAEHSNILRRHGQKWRGIVRQEKIHNISHSGNSIRGILSRDMFNSEDNTSKRKDRLKVLIEDLNLSITRIGTTLDERIDVLFEALKTSTESEFNALSASGFKALLDRLTEIPDPISISNDASSSPSSMDVIDRLRNDFEIEDNESLDTDRLRALGISPLDILYTYSNEEIKKIRDLMGLSNRQNPRTAIIDSFASANDRFVDNYELLACRDVAGLKAAGIEIKEADIGVKFEEITRTLLEQLGQNIDEELRKEVNSSKDKADIVLSLSDNDIIIGEAKSHKNGDYAKYSTTSRQLKSYVSHYEANGHHVTQVLIVAPSFSEDFIESAEMDTDVNISLLEAGGLKKIVDAYKGKRNPNFSAKLLTKGGLLKSDLIAKKI
jgi:hypothetical protein